MDIGCGSGLSGIGLKKAGFLNLDGVDPSRGLLKIAKEKNIYRKLIEGKITETDRIDLPADSGQYNCLICIGCITINHIDLKYAIPEFYRLLKIGGIAVYTISPSLDKMKALEHHLSYFAEQKFELLQLERRFFRKRVANKTKDDFSHLYAIMKVQ